MKSQRITGWVLSGGMMFVGIGLPSGVAQEPGNDPIGLREERRIDPRRVDPNSPPRLPDGTMITSWGGPDSKSAIRKAAEELRDAKDDEARDKAEANLRELLRNYFGEDMARREKELEAMQNRLKKLQEQLAKRHDKMQEIVDLQIKVLINEADGLGFFQQQSYAQRSSASAESLLLFPPSRAGEDDPSIGWANPCSTRGTFNDGRAGNSADRAQPATCPGFPII